MPESREFDTIWPLELHSQRKLEVLEKYLSAWFVILTRSKHHKRLVIYDAFCGPGRYLPSDTLPDKSNHSLKGSPIRAIRAALNYEKTQNQYIDFIFSDNNEGRLNVLREELQKLRPLPDNWGEPIILHGDFCDIYPKVINDYFREKDTAHFSLIDPFSYDSVNLSDCIPFLDYPSSEVLLNFNIGGWWRAYHKDDIKEKALTAIHANNDIFKKRKDVDLFVQNYFKNKGFFLNDIRAKNTTNNWVYSLYFVTRSERGMEVYDKVLFQINPNNGRLIYSHKKNEQDDLFSEVDRVEDAITDIKWRFGHHKTESSILLIKDSISTLAHVKLSDGLAAIRKLVQSGEMIVVMDGEFIVPDSIDKYYKNMRFKFVD